MLRLFAFSVPSAEHLVNIIRSLKPDGIAMVTVNGKAWREVDWPSKLESFEEEYAGHQVLGIHTIDYLTAEGIDGRLLIIKRD